MSKVAVTVFVCTGKDCSKAWRRICDGSPTKWLKRHVGEAGRYKLHLVKTECMDRCDDAATCCFVRGTTAAVVERLREPDDEERLLAALRSCVE